ncbi:MAG TPA: YfiR family protein [Nevskiaceae bacterium]|nr:YfiR family protein [Nevskiaceae bacterium]
MKRRGQVSWLRRIAAIAAAAAIVVAPAHAATEVDRVQQIKAAYLYNFARFVTWPPEKVGADKAIEFCILDGDPLKPALDEVLQGKTIDTQRVVVRHTARVEDMRSCHVAYLGGVDPARVGAALDALAGASVLTVYEGSDTQRAGAIRFFLEDRKVRFEINLPLARREHLELSSHLLNVARVIQD